MGGEIGSGEGVVVNLEEEEICVDCDKGLGYLKKEHITTRSYYVEGHGDHCRECFAVCPMAKLFIQG